MVPGVVSVAVAARAGVELTTPHPDAPVPWP